MLIVTNKPFMLSVTNKPFMLNVIMLNVFMLIVVAHGIRGPLVITLLTLSDTTSTCLF
jgi:hypothetical protein